MATSSNSHDRLLVLVSVATLLIFSAAGPSAAQTVLDSEGDPVRIGSLYRISKEGIGFFGGLTRLPLPKPTACARYIGPGEETDSGLPLSITPGNSWEASDGVLSLGVRSKVVFQVSSPFPCVGSGEWTETQANSSDAEPFTAIVAGRKRGRPAKSIWFEVRPTEKERVYKLVYCPCLPCRIMCLREVGGYTVGSKSVLGLEGRSFRFRFEKALPVQGSQPLVLAE